MHVGWGAVWSLPFGVERPTLWALRARVSARLDSLPRSRQRLAPGPGGPGDARWIDDPEFDITAHVTLLGDPGWAPVSDPHLAALRDALLGEPLTRTRPLWHIAVAPRLTDGRLAMILRLHRVLADGITLREFAALLLDITDGDAPPPPVELLTLGPQLDELMPFPPRENDGPPSPPAPRRLRLVPNGSERRPDDGRA